MPCCQEPDAKTPAAGCGCGGARPFPWFSALCDPAMGRLFLRRYRRELLLGLGAGTLASLGALALGDGAVVLGSLWVHLHAAAVVPAALLGGLGLAFGMAGGRVLAASGRVLGAAVLGGVLNGLLDGGSTASVVVFAALGLPALWLGWGLLALAFRAPDATR